MKTLYINRHAKSSWDDTKMADFDRPLNERGLQDAPEMGKRLADRNEGIERFFSSPAKRAIHTARLIAKELGYPEEKIEERQEIYQAGVSQLLKLVNSFDNKIDKIILFGHNPGFTDLVDYLSGAGIMNLPTCGICKISFDVDGWQEISAHTGDLEYFDFPKNQT